VSFCFFTYYQYQR